MSTHEERRAKARTVNNEPTMTDQSAASQTDLNLILQRYAQSGTLNSHGKEPMYMDWTEYPEDYRDFIHKTREISELRERLPQELRDIPTEQLLYITPEELHARLKPKDAQPLVQPENETGGTK